MSDSCTGQHADDCPWCDCIRLSDEMGVELARDIVAVGESINLRPSEIYLRSTRSYEPYELSPAVLESLPWWRRGFWFGRSA